MTLPNPDDALLAALNRATDDDAVRRAVAEHALPPDEIPRDGHALRALARDVAPERGRTILDALLEDLVRFEAHEEDSDHGWLHSETLRWERWAYERARADLDAVVNVDALRGIRDRDEARRALAVPARAAEEEDVLDAIHRVTRAALALEAAGEPEAARVLAVTGIAVEHACESNRAFAISEPRSAIAAEEIAPLLHLVKSTPRDARKLVAKLAAAETAAVGTRIRDLLGRGDADERAEAIAVLERRRAAARSDDTRAEIDRELLFYYGDDLSQDEVLELCRRLAAPAIAVGHLLRWGRAEEAERLADETLAADVAPYVVSDLAAAFLDGGAPARAASILKARSAGDLKMSELLTRALVAVGSSEAVTAGRAWFALRPTAETYRTVVALVPDAKEDLLAYLRAKKLHSSLLDVAIAEDDIAAIDATVAVLDPRLLDHARAALAPLHERLAATTRARLEPPPPSAPAPPPPKKEKAAAPPRFVVHSKFGRGEVKRAEGTGDEAKLTIAFEGHGDKTLLARFVKPA